MKCVFCGLEIREGDDHGKIGLVTIDGEIPITCRVTVWAKNPNRLGIVTDIRETETPA